MALVDVPETTYPPWGLLLGTWTSDSFETLQLDAINERAAFIFQIPHTGDVVGAEWRTSTVTTGSTMIMRMETVDLTTGFPAVPGSLYHANADGTCVLTATTDNNKIITDGFGGGTAWGTVPVTRGDLVSITIGQPGASAGNVLVAGHRSGTPKPTTVNSFPYMALYSGASPAWASHAAWGSLGLEYSGGIYKPINEYFMPFKGYTEVAFANNSATKEYGAKITVPMKCRTIGIKMQGQLDIGDAVITLYNNSGTALISTATIDETAVASQGGGNAQGTYTYYWTAGVELAANDVVYVGLKPQTTSNTELAFLTVESAARLDGLPSAGKRIRVERATQGSGTWTETTTQDPRMSLVIDQLDDGTGGASGAVLGVPNLRGNMQA